MMAYIKYLSMLIVMLPSMGFGQIQPPSKQQTEQLFKGTWVDKKTTRHLEISFDSGYATIIDWTSKFQKRENGDVYKAFLKNGKLITPEDTSHHAPYSEIIWSNHKLIYLTKPLFAGKTTEWDKQVFTRSKTYFPK